MIELQILSGVKAGNSIKSDLSTILIGREPDCTLQLDPYHDLLVHGQHAKIYFSEGNYYLEDLNTKNGTYYNDQSIKEPIKLDTGSKFRLGDGGPEIQVGNWNNLLESKLVSSPTLFQLVRKGNKEIHSFSQISVKIGRQPECELSLDPLKERQVSGYHAVIRQEKDGCYLEDLGSANGTFLNDAPCKREKLENGNMIRLGTDGPEFEFVLSNKASVVKPKVKRSRKRKKFPDKKSENPNKHLWIAAGVVVFLLLFILIVSSGSSPDIKTAINRHRANVVFLYCRYLVDIGDTTVRMQKYGCGVLRRVGEQTTILTPDINIFPWKYGKQKGDIKIRSHFVAAWPYNSTSLTKSIAIPYQRLEFINSFNSSFERLGGNGQLILPREPKSKNPTICRIIIKDKFNSLLTPTSWRFSNKKISNNKVYCISYLHPLNTTSKNGRIPIMLFEGLWKNSTISFPNAITGAPMLNAQGELLALFYAKTQTKGTYISIP